MRAASNKKCTPHKVEYFLLNKWENERAREEKKAFQIV